MKGLFRTERSDNAIERSDTDWNVPTQRRISWQMP